MRWGWVVAKLLGALLLLAACSTADDPSDATSDGYSEPAPGEESVAYQLAAVGGDLGDEAAFQDAIDCIMASGIEGAETEEKVGDTLYASWVEGGKPGTLLEWAQAFC